MPMGGSSSSPLGALGPPIKPVASSLLRAHEGAEGSSEVIDSSPQPGAVAEPPQVAVLSVPPVEIVSRR